MADKSDWMAAEEIQKKTLTNVCLPGIHHPASYSFMTGNTGAYVTTNIDVYTVLTKGVRYFDSRPAFYKGQIVEYHVDSFGASYNSLLKQFNDFFEGFNTLVDHGRNPVVKQLNEDTFMIVYDSDRIIELSDHLNMMKMFHSIKT